ncbi:MAG: hypothetical protein ABI045_01235 [Flavobacteriales bacterium]
MLLETLWNFYRLAHRRFDHTNIPIPHSSFDDQGIGGKNLSLIWALLSAQLFLFLDNSVIKVLRNWIMLNISTQINISLVSNFPKKIHEAVDPFFFNTPLIGNFTQHIHDHKRIDSFFTSESLLTLFSLINFSIFFLVLALYSRRI